MTRVGLRGWGRCRWWLVVVEATVAATTTEREKEKVVSRKQSNIRMGDAGEKANQVNERMDAQTHTFTCALALQGTCTQD